MPRKVKLGAKSTDKFRVEVRVGKQGGRSRLYSGYKYKFPFTAERAGKKEARKLLRELSLPMNTPIALAVFRTGNVHMGTLKGSLKELK